MCLLAFFIFCSYWIFRTSYVKLYSSDFFFGFSYIWRKPSLLKGGFYEKAHSTAHRKPDRASCPFFLGIREKAGRRSRVHPFSRIWSRGISNCRRTARLFLRNGSRACGRSESSVFRFLHWRYFLHPRRLRSRTDSPSFRLWHNSKKSEGFPGIQRYYGIAYRIQSNMRFRHSSRAHAGRKLYKRR